MNKIFYCLILFTCALTSCSQRILVQQTTGSFRAGEKLVEKSRGITMTTTNDQYGILVNIRVPDQYDQFKILKYGAHLSVSLHNANRADYEIAYPLKNEDQNLFIPDLSVTDTSFHMGQLLSELSDESKTMNLTGFYNVNRAGIPSNDRDNVAVQVYTDDNHSHELVYSAFIPYRSVAELSRSAGRGSSIRIGFESGALKVRRSDRAPGFSPNVYIPYKDHDGRRNEQLDPRILAELARPVHFWSPVQLTTNVKVELTSR